MALTWVWMLAQGTLKNLDWGRELPGDGGSLYRLQVHVMYMYILYTNIACKLYACTCSRVYNDKVLFSCMLV